MDAAQTAAAHEALLTAIARAGGQSEFSRRTNVKQQTVSYRVRRGLPMPGEAAIPAEEEFGVPRHVSRPDLYPAGSPATSPTGSPKGSVGTGGAIVRCDRAASLQGADHA